MIRGSNENSCCYKFVAYVFIYGSIFACSIMLYDLYFVVHETRYYDIFISWISYLAIDLTLIEVFLDVS